MFYVVGDLHGKYELAEAALALNEKIIFLGDYVDDWDRTLEDQERTIDIVSKAAKSEPDRVIMLLGNHDLQYLDKRASRSSGFTTAMYYHLLPKRDILDVAKKYYTYNSYLFTHAGVSVQWAHLPTTATLEEIVQYLNSPVAQNRWNQVGYARGGTVPVGGPVWCDDSEMLSFATVPQIVGHNRVSLENGNFPTVHNVTYIDCLHDSLCIAAVDGESITPHFL